MAVAPAELRLNTPVPLLKLAAMLPIVAPSLVNDSTSCPATKLVTATVALANVPLSTSLAVSTGLIASAAAFSV